MWKERGEKRGDGVGECDGCGEEKGGRESGWAWEVYPIGWSCCE